MIVVRMADLSPEQRAIVHAYLELGRRRAEKARKAEEKPRRQSPRPVVEEAA